MTRECDKGKQIVHAQPTKWQYGEIEQPHAQRDQMGFILWSVQQRIP